MNYTAQIRVLLILTMLLSAAAGFCHAGPLEDGDAYLKDKRASEAEAAYTQALATTPDSVKALIGRGRARQALGNKEGAAADFDRAVKLAPTNGEALGYRANFRELAMNDYKGAIEDYNRYIVLHPKSSTAYLDRGRTLQKAGSLSDALADLDKSVALKADVSAAHAVRGLVLEKMGRNAEAFESYQKALELKPDNPRPKRAWNSCRPGWRGSRTRPGLPIHRGVGPEAWQRQASPPISQLEKRIRRLGHRTKRRARV